MGHLSYLPYGTRKPHQRQQSWIKYAVRYYIHSWLEQKGDPGNTKLSSIWNVKNHNINFAFNVSVKVLIRNKTGIIRKIKVLTTENNGLKYSFKWMNNEWKNQVQRGTTTKRLVDKRERPCLCNKRKDQLEKPFFRKRIGQNKQISPLSKSLRCL